MPIVKGGFTPGSHGRKQQASFGRRVQYLSTDHDRDKATLLNGKGEEITRGKALEVFGGKDAVYHEVIYAPSEVECRALEERFGGPEAAQKEMARQLASRLSPDRPCLLAAHTHGDRWHLHMPIQGEAHPRLLGPAGKAQRAWDEVLRATQPRERIVDWDAHQRFKELQGGLKGIQREQWQLDRERYHAVRNERNPSLKLEVARCFDKRSLALVAHRHQLELGGIQAKYEARGRVGSWDHQAEAEKAAQRRARGENRVQRRAEKTRERVEGRGLEVGKGAARRTDRVLAQGRERTLRAAERVVGIVGRMVERGVDTGLRGAGVPTEARLMVRAGLKVGREAVRLTLKTIEVVARAGWKIGMEAAPAAGRQAVHAAKITAKMGLGAILAIPTLGKSLGVAVKETGQDLATAGKDLLKDGVRIGQTVSQEAGKASMDVAQEGLRSVTSLGMEALPRPIKEAARGAIQVSGAAGRVAADLVQLNPMAAAVSLGKGGLDVLASGGRALHGVTKLPEAIRVPLVLLEKMPVVGLAAKAAKVTSEIGLQLSRGPELGLDR